MQAVSWFGKEKTTRLVSFLFVLGSSIGFSLLLLSVRYYGVTSQVSEIIDYQSKVVFFSFLFQAGLRSAVRNLIHFGKIKSADLSVSVLITLLSLIMVFYFLSLPFNSSHLYLTTAGLVAVTTLTMSVSIAKSDNKKIVISSVFNILAIVVPGLMVIIFDAKEELFSELASIFLAIVFLLFIGFFPSLKLKRANPVFKYGFPMQLGSFFIYSSIFLFAQIVVNFSKENQVLPLVYADAQIVSGVILLLLSKSLLFLEGRIYKNNNFSFIYGCSIVLLLFVSLVFSIVETTLIENDSALMMAFMVFLILSSRLPAGYLVQYLKSTTRNVSLIFLSLSSLVFLSIYISRLRFDSSILVICFVFSLYTVCVGYLFYSLTKKEIFISKASHE
ncbi:hypothetical protein [Litchfieldella anticariensis]|uniref:hypothetical protein n=1 Tax=Litchfieldella anticariensis TaxID=258591 RepID=UPI0004281C6A|nr:hypothetical protein [Halomonas anticariensis]